MSATIPPLMCDTPPPIEDVLDDDFGGFETTESGYNYDDSTSLKMPIDDDDCVSCSDLPPVPDDIPTTPNFIRKTDEILLDTPINTPPTQLSCDLQNIDDESIQITTTNVQCPEIKSNFDDNRILSNKISDQKIILTEDSNLPNEYRAESPPSLIFSSSAIDTNYNDDIDKNDDDDDGDNSLNRQQLPDEMYTNLSSLKLDSLPNSMSESDEIKIECPSKTETDDLPPDSIPNHITNDSSSLTSSPPPISDDYGNDDQLFQLPIHHQAQQQQQLQQHNAETALVLADRKNDYESTQPSPQDDELDTSFGDFSDFTVGEVQVPDDATLNCDSSKVMTIDADFTADFSQFDAISSSGGNNIAVAVGDICDDGEDGQQATCRDFDDDDEFDDFTTFNDVKVQTTTDISEPLQMAAISNDIADNDDDDDDFGDFNDFTQSQSITVPSLSMPQQQQSMAQSSIVPNLTIDNVSEKIKLLLDMMFPGDNEQDDEESNGGKSAKQQQVDSSTTCQLKNFDNSKASEHLWSNSVGKNALVTALGIDLRNILYGGQWNSSMPRFAANLGFSPLEPMKTSLSSASVSAITTSATPTTTMQSGSGIKSNTSTDIPDVQFDWTSSGLVNPLDASHAHTLLLDLEQLVVVANLDKITIDSPTCSAIVASSSSTSITTSSLSTMFSNSFVSATISTKPITSTTPAYSYSSALQSLSYGDGDGDGLLYTNGASMMDFLNNASSLSLLKTEINNFSLSTVVNTINSATFSTTTSTTTTATNKNEFGLFDQYLDNRIQEILHKASPTQDQSTRSEFDWKTTTTTTESSGLNVITTHPQIKTKPPPIYIPNSAITPAAALDTQQSNQITDDDIDDDLPAPTSASYSVPGSSGTLKETHIFTPNKIHASPPIGRTANAETEATAVCPDFDYEKAAAGIIINENVVKKEYRDVEYNPDVTLSGGGGGGCSGDDFSDFQSSVPTTSTTIPSVGSSKSLDSHGFSEFLQPTKTETKSSSSNCVINWSEPDKLPDGIPAVTVADSFDVFLSAPVPIVLPSSNDSVVKLDEPQVIAKPILPKSSMSYSKPVIGISPTEQMFGSNVINHPSSSSCNVNKCSDANVDDEFSDFQCVAPTITTSASIVPSPAAPQTSNILMPQTLMPSQSLSSIATKPSSTSIDWPDPGICSDELARLEAIFPTPSSRTTQKSKVFVSQTKSAPTTKATPTPISSPDDDEWSDFVAANPSSQPITHVLSQHISKLQASPTKSSRQSTNGGGDDDDWSDFVSNTSSSNNTSSIGQWNSGPKFTSWNAPPQFSDWQNASIYKPPPQFYSTNNNTNGYNYNGNNFNHHTTTNVQNTKLPTGIPTISNISNSSSGSGSSNFYQNSTSISLIPDLGFIAPTKSFSINGGSNNSSNSSNNSSSNVNRPRMINFSGKK